MHVRVLRREHPPVLGYGARVSRGVLTVELLSVHEAIAPGPVPAWLYPGGKPIILIWPGLKPGVYRGRRLNAATTGYPAEEDHA